MTTEANLLHIEGRHRRDKNSDSVAIKINLLYGDIGRCRRRDKDKGSVATKMRLLYGNVVCVGGTHETKMKIP